MYVIMWTVATRKSASAVNDRKVSAKAKFIFHTLGS